MRDEDGQPPHLLGRRQFLHLAVGAAALPALRGSLGRKPIRHGRCGSSLPLPRDRQWISTVDCTASGFRNALAKFVLLCLKKFSPQNQTWRGVAVKAWPRSCRALSDRIAKWPTRKSSGPCSEAPLGSPSYIYPASAVHLWSFPATCAITAMRREFASPVLR